MGSFDTDCELGVFVYGTLKPGGRYHRRYCAQFLTAALPAQVKGELYDFPQLGYPALTPGDDWVQGYLLRFCQTAAVCADILHRLDALEGYVADKVAGSDDDYHRCQLQIFDSGYELLQTAWVYRMSQAQVRQQGGVYLPDGNWPVSY
ncbi:MAG: gamma-glutamylcyclotransferase [Phormidesmis sp.]